jgi:hypothetical protein
MRASRTSNFLYSSCMKKALLLVCLACVSMSATTLTFEYTGARASQGLFDRGFGSFTYADGLTTVNLAELTSFTFDDIQDGTQCGLCHQDPNFPDFVNIHFGLADLLSFNLVSDATHPPTDPLHFTLSTTGGLQGFDVFEDAGQRLAGIGLAVGPISFTPEPGTLFLLLPLALLMAVLRRRRRQQEVQSRLA